MIGFSRVREILDLAVGGATFGAHGPFWRGQTRDQFVAHSVFGRPLLAVLPDGSFDADASNILKALKGESPFGSDLVPRPAGAIFRRMPGGRPPVPDSQIAEIHEWITGGCP